jgi:hypothetical protein
VGLKEGIPYVRFEVFWAVKIIMTMFWVLAPCRLVGRFQRFGDTHSLHHTPIRWRQYVSPKRWHLPTSLHGAKTQTKIKEFLSFDTSTTTIIIRAMGVIFTCAFGDVLYAGFLRWKLCALKGCICILMWTCFRHWGSCLKHSTTAIY